MEEALIYKQQTSTDAAAIAHAAKQPQAWLHDTVW